jgi:hypothetical protein
MNKEQAINEVTRLRKFIESEVEWNFGRMTEAAHLALEKVWKLEEEFKLPSSTPA